jgi:hypothetical protein
MIIRIPGLSRQLGHWRRAVGVEGLDGFQAPGLTPGPFFALTDDSRMIVANNLPDAMTIFDIDTRGELRASGQVAVRRPVFIAPFGPP